MNFCGHLRALGFATALKDSQFFKISKGRGLLRGANSRQALILRSYVSRSGLVGMKAWVARHGCTVTVH